MLSLISANAHAATCATQSSYTSGTQDTGANCSTYQAQLNFTAGGYVKSCNTCPNTATRVATTVTHSSGCTYTRYDCAISSYYAKAVANCTSSSLSSFFENLCDKYDRQYLGSDSTLVISNAGLSSSQYGHCGVYNLSLAGGTTTKNKAVVCFQNHIYVDGEYVSGADMAKHLGNCSSVHYGDDYSTNYFVRTDWGGENGGTFSISNYAQFKCCNIGSCMGYGGSQSTNAGAVGVVVTAKYCTYTGACSETTSGGYATCNPGYYSQNGLQSKTIDSASTNPAHYVSNLQCKLCSTNTSNDSATSEIGSDAITDCYLPTGYGETDTTGTWKYASDCHYSN